MRRAATIALLLLRPAGCSERAGRSRREDLSGPVTLTEEDVMGPFASDVLGAEWRCGALLEPPAGAYTPGCEAARAVLKDSADFMYATIAVAGDATDAINQLCRRPASSCDQPDGPGRCCPAVEPGGRRLVGAAGRAFAEKARGYESAGNEALGVRGERATPAGGLWWLRETTRWPTDGGAVSVRTLGHEAPLYLPHACAGREDVRVLEATLEAICAKLEKGALGCVDSLERERAPDS